jgi:hypothetical protein
LLHDALALLVAALAEVVMADPPLRVGDVHGGPVMVRERLPDAVPAVDRDGIRDAVLLDRPADVVDVPLEGELGRVHADDDQSLFLVLVGPGTDVAERAQPVDARVRPEVDEHDLAAQPLGGERLRVEPARRTVEGRQAALDVRRVQTVEQAHERAPLNAARISAEKTSGSSQAAKWPPFSASLK